MAAIVIEIKKLKLPRQVIFETWSESLLMKPAQGSTLDGSIGKFLKKSVEVFNWVKKVKFETGVDPNNGREIFFAILPGVKVDKNWVKAFITPKKYSEDAALGYFVRGAIEKGYEEILGIEKINLPSKSFR